MSWYCLISAYNVNPTLTVLDMESNFSVNSNIVRAQVLRSMLQNGFRLRLNPWPKWISTFFVNSPLPLACGEAPENWETLFFFFFLRQQRLSRHTWLMRTSDVTELLSVNDAVRPTLARVNGERAAPRRDRAGYWFYLSADLVEFLHQCPKGLVGLSGR